MAITKLLCIKESADKNPAAHLKNAIKYICNPEKTNGGLLIGGNAGVTAEGIYNAMMLNKKTWGKTDLRQGYHYVLSFPPDCGVDENTVMKIAEEFTQELLHGNFLNVIAVHNDKDHLHVHIIFDSVSQTDGYKFHSPKGDWESRIQPITDRLCKKYNLPTLSYEEEKEERKGKNYQEWKHEQDKKKGHGDGFTPYDIIRDDIDEAIAHSDTYGGFLEYLKTEMKYQVTRNKSGLSLRPNWRGNAVRTSRLGAGYSKQEIIGRISNKKYEPDFEKRYKQYGDMKEIRGMLIYKTKRQPGFKMSPFQRRYVQRYYRAIMIRRPVYDQSWRYKSDILKAKKISRCTVKMLKYDIHSLEDTEKRKQEFISGKEAAELEIKALKTKIYRNEPTRYVWKYKKLQTEYLKSGDPEVKNQMDLLMGKMISVCPYEEAETEYEQARAELKKLQNVVKDYKSDIKTMDDIRELFYEPAHAMETIAARKTEKDGAKQNGQNQRGRNHRNGQGRTAN